MKRTRSKIRNFQLWRNFTPTLPKRLLAWKRGTTVDIMKVVSHLGALASEILLIFGWNILHPWNIGGQIWDTGTQEWRSLQSALYRRSSMPNSTRKIVGKKCMWKKVRTYHHPTEISFTSGKKCILISYIYMCIFIFIQPVFHLAFNFHSKPKDRFSVFTHRSHVASRRLLALRG